MNFLLFRDMKQVLFLLLVCVLAGCEANKSSDVPKAKSATPDSMVAQAPMDTPAVNVKSIVLDTMTTEEADVAAKIGAVKVSKMADDTFKVSKMVAAEEFQKYVEFEAAEMFSDSVLMVGVVSGKGKWLVPMQYTDVHQLTKDVFVGHLTLALYDYEMTSPDAYTEFYQVVYRGKPIGRFTHVCNIEPIYYHKKLSGFLKTFYDTQYRRYSVYYIDTKGKGWDAWVGFRMQSHPHFEYYKIRGKVLTLWGGAKSPEDLAAFFPEDRSLYQVDLSSGRVLANPYVAVE